MPKPSHFIWYELITSDVDAAAKFDGAIVGWTVQSAGQPGMDYRHWLMGADEVGGPLTISPEAEAQGINPRWLSYVDGSDIDGATRGIEAAGGAVHMPAGDVPAGSHVRPARPQEGLRIR